MVGQWRGDRAVTLGSSWALSQWAAPRSSAGAQCSRAVLTQHHGITGTATAPGSAWAQPLMGAVGPSCNSACSAREPGNIITALLCVMHRHLVKQEQRGEILAPIESVGVLTLLLVQDYTPWCFYWLEISHLHMDSSHSWDHHIPFIAIFILHPSCFATVINGK